MDFLDPKKKRNQKITLAIGHTLMVVFVAVATFILMLQAYGYNIDRKSGEVIQNGLVYIDSAPSGGKIKLNNQEIDSKTNTRLALPEGDYSIEISKDGYRSWMRTLSLEGGAVERFTYPLLFLNDLKPEELKVFDKTLGLATQSPDRRWIVLSQKNLLDKLTIYDLGSRQNKKPTSEELTLPANLFTEAGGSHVVELVEWSTDNKNLLVLHTWKAGREFVDINIDKPNNSFNVSQISNQSPSKMFLFDKKPEKFFLYDASKKTLNTFDVKTKEIKSVSEDVLSFKPHGDDKILMAVIDPADKKKTNIILRENDTDHIIRSLPSNSKILLDIAQVGSDWYAAVADSKDKLTYVYRNPVEYVSKNRSAKNSSAFILRAKGQIDQLSFSDNTRFIMAKSKQSFNIYDTETNRIYDYTIKQKFDPKSKLTWMDGHRLIVNSSGKTMVFDYDGINLQYLINANPIMPIMFDRDYTELYSLDRSVASKTSTGLFSTQLRLEQDK